MPSGLKLASIAFFTGCTVAVVVISTGVWWWLSMAVLGVGSVITGLSAAAVDHELERQSR